MSKSNEYLGKLTSGFTKGSLQTPRKYDTQANDSHFHSQPKNLTTVVGYFGTRRQCLIPGNEMLKRNELARLPLKTETL